MISEDWISASVRSFTIDWRFSLVDWTTSRWSSWNGIEDRGGFSKVEWSIQGGQLTGDRCAQWSDHWTWTLALKCWTPHCRYPIDRSLVAEVKPRIGSDQRLFFWCVVFDASSRANSMLHRHSTLITRCQSSLSRCRWEGGDDSHASV